MKKEYLVNYEERSDRLFISFNGTLTNLRFINERKQMHSNMIS